MNEIMLDRASEGRNNNLNFLRFLAALMVVYSHSYPLSIRGGGTDLLENISNGQINFGGVAVYIFFFFSGFFLNRSAYKEQGFFTFIRKRCIRIFPCLVSVVFICTFVLGAGITECKLLEYFCDRQTYNYLLNAILVLQHNLPGVFKYNTYGATVNGSLWTLPVEFLCYIGCGLACKVGLSKRNVMKYTIVPFMVCYMVMYVMLDKIPLFRSALGPCMMFYSGMLYDTYRNKICIRKSVFVLCFVVLMIATFFGFLKYGIMLLLPYILVCIAFGTKKKLNRFGYKHEISYGMYLCAWPIQQTVVMLYGGSMNPMKNFLISIPFIILMGYVLNILVEQPILRKYK